MSTWWIPVENTKKKVAFETHSTVDDDSYLQLPKTISHKQHDSGIIFHNTPPISHANIKINKGNSPIKQYSGTTDTSLTDRFIQSYSMHSKNKATKSSQSGKNAHSFPIQKTDSTYNKTFQMQQIEETLPIYTVKSLQDDHLETQQPNQGNTCQGSSQNKSINDADEFHYSTPSQLHLHVKKENIFPQLLDTSITQQSEGLSQNSQYQSTPQQMTYRNHTEGQSQSTLNSHMPDKRVDFSNSGNYSKLHPNVEHSEMKSLHGYSCERNTQNVPRFNEMRNTHNDINAQYFGSFNRNIEDCNTPSHISTRQDKKQSCLPVPSTPTSNTYITEQQYCVNDKYHNTSMSSHDTRERIPRAYNKQPSIQSETKYHLPLYADQTYRSYPDERHYSLHTGEIPMQNFHVRHHKTKEPDKFDGQSVEWRDYQIHFENVAKWNNWDEIEKAQQLVMSLRGSAQKLLSDLNPYQINSYTYLVNVLRRRFNPAEREIAFRCEFRNRKQAYSESAADYGYALQKLCAKAYPTIQTDAREIYIIDQFINGLLKPEIRSHVQYRHPLTIDAAIALAVEFEAFEGTHSILRKPRFTSDMPQDCNSITNKGKESSSLEEIASLLKILNETLSRRSRSRSNSRDRNPNIECYKCHEKGHIASKCPTNISEN